MPNPGLQPAPHRYDSSPCAISRVSWRHVIPMKKADMSRQEDAEGKELNDHLVVLRRLREQGKDANRRPRRSRLSAGEWAWEDGTLATT